MSEENQSNPPLPTPPEPVSDQVRRAVIAEGDQLRTDEIDIGGGITVAFGLRNIYVRTPDAKVSIVANKVV